MMNCLRIGIGELLLYITVRKSFLLFVTDKQFTEGSEDMEIGFDITGKFSNLKKLKFDC